MNIFEQLFPNPVKAVKGAWQDTKAAFEGTGKRRHDSVLGGFGKLTDPLTFTLGDKYTQLVHGAIPRELNRAMEPAVQFGHNLNPVYHYGKQTGNDDLNELHDMGNRKGADIVGLVLGGLFGGSALSGAMGGGAGGGSSGGAGAMNWQDPNTYIQLAQQMPQQQQQPPPSPSRVRAPGRPLASNMPDRVALARVLAGLRR